jgi:hypothetical protein
VGRSAPNLALAILIRPGDEQANLLLTAMSSELGVHDRPVSVSGGPYCARRVRSFPSCIFPPRAYSPRCPFWGMVRRQRRPWLAEGAFGLLTAVGSGEMSARSVACNSVHSVSARLSRWLLNARSRGRRLASVHARIICRTDFGRQPKHAVVGSGGAPTPRRDRVPARSRAHY